MSKEFFMGDGSQFSPEVFQAPNTGKEGPGGNKGSSIPKGGRTLGETPEEATISPLVPAKAVMPMAGGAGEGEPPKIGDPTTIEGNKGGESTEPGPEGKPPAPDRGEGGRERFFPEEISNIDAVWDRFEDFILTQENLPGKFDENAASTLVRAIELELSSNSDLQAALFNMLRTRYNYKNLRIALEEGSVDEYSGLLTGLVAKDQEIILALPGMEQALDIYENPDLWRKKERGGRKLNAGDRLQVVRNIMTNSSEMEGYRRRFGIDPSALNEEDLDLWLKEGDDVVDENDTDDVKRDKKLRLQDQQNQLFASWGKEKQKKKQDVALRLQKQVKRDVTLAKTAHNLVGSSVRYDGVVLKNGQNFELNSVPLRIPDDLGGGTINLVKLSEDDRKKMEAVRKNQGYLIPMAWDRAWRQFYIERWDDIDFEASLEGNAPVIIKRRLHNPIRYMKRSEANPGAPGTEPLKRITYVGTLPLIMVSMRGSVKEQLQQWSDDFMARLGAANRIKGGDKVRKMFNEEGPRLLYNPVAIGGFAKSLKDFQEAMSYLPAEEQQEQMAYMIEPIAKFSMDNLKKVFNYENQNAFTVDNSIRIAREQGYINSQQENRLKNEVILRDSVIKRIPGIGRMVLEMKVAFGGALKTKSALLEMLKLLFKQIFSIK